MEVWSRDNAPCKIQSYRALQLWETLLNRGCHTTATSGRDWHREDTYHYGHTYVLVEKLTKEAVLHAIKRGQICLAAGPLLTMKGICAEGTEVQIGDTIDAGKLEIVLELDSETMPNDWEKEAVTAKEIQLIQNGQILCQFAPKARQKISVEVTSGWLRVDLIGEFYGKKDQKIAMTNPIYIK